MYKLTPQLSVTGCFDFVYNIHIRADFNLRELPCYLSNTYEILLLMLKFIGEQDSLKIFCQVYNLLPWQPDFRRQILTFFISVFF